MCTNPIKIHNPFYEGDRLGVAPEHARFVSAQPTIEVPCGQCPDCLRSKTRQFIQRASIESLTSHVFNVTLTYDNEHLPVARFKDTINNCFVNVPYSDYTHIQNLVKRLRCAGLPQDRQFRYFVVSEFGKKRHRPHFHLLLFVARVANETPEQLQELCIWLYDHIKEFWAINRGSTRIPVYEPLFTYHSKMFRGKLYRNYDCKLVTPLVATEHGKQAITDLNQYLSQDNDPYSVVAYLCKYLNKSDQTSRELARFFNKNSYLDVDEVLIPRVHLGKLYRILATTRQCSKHFGCGFLPDGRALRITAPDARILSSQSLARREWLETVFSEYDSISKQDIETLVNLISLFPSFSDFRQNLDARSYHLFEFLVRIDTSVRRAVYDSDWTDFELPSKLHALSDYTRYIDSPNALICAYDKMPDTRSTLALRRIVDTCADSPYPYLSFQLNGRCSPLCAYYTRFVSLDKYSELYARLGVSSFDDYQSYCSSHTDENALERVRQSYSSDMQLFITNSSDFRSFVDSGLPRSLADLDTDNHSYVLTDDIFDKYSLAVQRYNYSYL